MPYYDNCNADAVRGDNCPAPNGILNGKEEKIYNKTTRRGQPLDSRYQAQVVGKLTRCFRIMHEEFQLVHRDIKPQNMLINEGHIWHVSFR